MKKFLVIISLLFSGVAIADTINLRFVNEDNTTYENTTCTVGGDVILPSTTPSKRGYNFVGWKIPQYVPVGYLENDPSKTYINTGYIADINTKIVADFSVESLNGSSNVFGVSNTSQTNLLITGEAFGSCTYCRYQFGATSGYVSCGCTQKKVTLDNVGVYVNNSQKASTNPTSYFYTSSLLVFAANNQTGITSSTIRIYSLQIYQNNILVHDYVPALDLDGEAGLYDKIDRNFLYNSGTGAFVAGPVIDYD